MKTVLIVERDRDFQESIRELIDSFGYQVVVATNAAQGDALLSSGQENVDCLLIGQTTPDADKINALASIGRTGNSLPTLVLTELSAPETVQRNDGLRDSDSLHLPFSANELKQRLNHILRDV